VPGIFAMSIMDRRHPTAVPPTWQTEATLEQQMGCEFDQIRGQLGHNWRAIRLHVGVIRPQLEGN
jgi:hypothetical protein